VAIQRVLQILKDTDATDQHLAALELHHGLTRSGCEVRTLALGPGKTGQLAQSVPVIAPSRKSLAAYTQLRAEQRWADGLILQGVQAAEVAAVIPGALPTAVGLWSEPADWEGGKRVSLRMAKAMRDGVQLVVTNAAATTSAQRVLDRYRGSTGINSESSGVQLIHTGVRLANSAKSAALSEASQTARRAAAKQALGLEVSRLAVRALQSVSVSSRGGNAGSSGGVREAALSGGAQFVDSLTASSADEELLLAATDVVIFSDCADGPSVELLRAMHTGAVAVAADSPAMGELVEDHVTGRRFSSVGSADGSLSEVLAELASNSQQRFALATAGILRVQAEYSLGQTQAQWLATLSSALA